MVILISRKEQDQAFAHDLAKAMDTECVLATRAGDGQIELLQKHPLAPVVFDAESEELYAGIESRLLKPDLLLPRIHFMGPESLDQGRYVFSSPFFHGYVVRSENADVMARGARLYSRLYREKPAALGIESTLGQERKERTFSIQSNLEKTKVLDGVRDFFQSTDLGERNLGILATSADELLMNAIFDAPVDEMGNRVSIATSRTSPIRLQGRRRIELSAGFSSSHVAVQVRDFFGSLERSLLFEKITRVYSLNEYKIDRKSAGAGLGLASVYRSGGSLLFHCEAGELTSVTALFPRAQTAQALRAGFHFIMCGFR